MSRGESTSSTQGKREPEAQERPDMADTLPADADSQPSNTTKLKLTPSQLPTLDAPPDYPFAHSSPTPSNPSLSKSGPGSDPLRLQMADASRYRIEGEYAQGGIGRILLAHDERLNRRVAVKELLRHRGQGEERFIREALLTARLEHPSIVPVYDAGRRPTGELFFAMKLVSGRSLEEIIAETPDWKERLALLPQLLAASEAIAYAHSKLVIHRDLKPSNILIGEFGETMVIDWGLGKDISKPNANAPDDAQPSMEINTIELPNITMEGAIMGTPAYMAPEQAVGKAVDERADVYALGAILYQLLSGRPPFLGDDAQSVLSAVQHEEPPPLQSLQKGLPDDLLAIVRKAMAKDPAGRYPSAREFADDLRRFQTGQIVGAHAYSKTELVLRFARRYKAPLAIAFTALVLLTGAGIFGFKNIVKQRDRAEQKEAIALRRSDELVIIQAKNALESDPSQSIEWLRHLSPLFSQWTAARNIAADAEGRGLPKRIFHHKGAIAGIAFSPDGQTLVSAGHDRSLQWISLSENRARTLAGHKDEVWQAAFSADGRFLASAGKDGLIQLWTEGGAENPRLLAHHKAGVRSLAFSPNPKRPPSLVSLSWDDSLILWDCNSLEPKIIASPIQSMTNAAFSPDGTLIAAGSDNNTVKLWNTEGELIHTLSGHQDAPLIVAFSSLPHLLASAGRDTTVRIWNLMTQESIVCNGHGDELSALAFSPNGKILASAGKDAVIRLWDSTSGTLLRTLTGHKASIRSLAFSPDGNQILSSSEDRSAGLWDIKHGEGRFFYGFRDGLSSALFSPDGQTIAAASLDGTLRLFQAHPSNGQILSDPEAQITAFSGSPFDSRIAAGYADGMVYIYHQNEGDEPLRFMAHESPVTEIVFSPGGELFATKGRDGAVRVWDSVAHEVWNFDSIELGSFSPSVQLAFSPSGQFLAHAAKDGALLLMDVIAGTRQVLAQAQKGITRIVFLPNSDELIAGNKSGALLLFALPESEPRVLREQGEAVKQLVISPDGHTLSVGNTAPSLRLIDLHTGQSHHPGLTGGLIGKLLFSPDGKTLFLFCWPESVVRRISVTDSKELPSLRGHSAGITHLALSPDGTRLISSSYDKTLLLWDIESGDKRVLRGHSEAVLGAHFLPGGDWISSMGADNTIRLWPDDLPRDGEGLRASVEALAIGAQTLGK